ncbi:spermidine synthase [Usitatibacter palustris]|uniref:Polyamine aminopropyltransferase n=1 Tax=Usitatibacter palustris TaxID=2732487 RepID=A0A6M4H4L3_9PROT|nr:spermidine synthase [Usitatibacter palustris]QJR14571.1 Polyamine aminopropyltransferase [Usitatibacter palustris]
MTTRIPVGVFFALFTISGFAGLIYESIWSHYLKLFLGHAAYAQTLVLAIFMGGMAIGSWLVSRFTHRIPNLLMGYAIAELGIGVLAITFHGMFVGVIDWAFVSVIPALGSPGAVDLFKWALASALILPASMLLGSTFPLMSAGIMRLYPTDSTRTLSWLYFTNGFGASIGVLASGFYLIERLGLPGTILTAGIMNVGLALLVWALSKALTARAPERTVAADATKRLTLAIAGIAFVTGAASFMYEIAWIRMLTMGLGASTHAFELMLSAFILGMAIGGLVLALRAPRQERQGVWLAGILFAKGFLAVLAIASYAQVLEFIGWMMTALNRTESGYVLLNVAGHWSSMAVMFPAAMCAGMTLPLATAFLLSRGGGEASIGRVYAANTAGCIVGAAFSTHVGMELLGVKGLTGFGAACDIAMGAAVALLVTKSIRTAWRPAVAIAIVAVATFSALDLNKLKMASGVFRSGEFLDPAIWNIEYYKDGKTATISVTGDGKLRAIRTNGKPDAGLMFSPANPPTWDESTMVLIAGLALAHKPDAKTIANIGFGSGLTTVALLGSDKVQVVDTIEIEPAMVEGARLFEKFNAAAYSDPRSHIRIEDAKTFFAANRSKYDVIVSEPSNPWVSGVATLFSDEFYARMRNHINEGGFLMQWMHVYEIDFDLVSSVLKALGRNFSDYRIYTTQPGDIFIVAARDGKVPELSDDLFQQPKVRERLNRVGYHSLAEMRLDLVATRRVIEPLVNQGRYPMNSDYFPVIDQHAAKARFTKANALEFNNIPKTFIPFGALFGQDSRIQIEELSKPSSVASKRVGEAHVAVEMANVFLTNAPPGKRLAPSGRIQASLAREGLTNCSLDGTFWVDALEDMLRSVTPVLRGSVNDRIFSNVRGSACFKNLAAPEKDRVALYEAFAKLDAPAMKDLSDRLLAARSWNASDRTTFVLAGTSARIAMGDLKGGRQFWEQHRDRILVRISTQIPVRAMLAHLYPTAPDGTKVPEEDVEKAGDRPAGR